MYNTYVWRDTEKHQQMKYMLVSWNKTSAAVRGVTGNLAYDRVRCSELRLLAVFRLEDVTNPVQ